MGLLLAMKCACHWVALRITPRTYLLPFSIFLAVRHCIVGLPSVFGLYGAFIPCIIYAFVGSSRQLSVGPVALTSLMIGTTLQHLVPGAAEIGNPNEVHGHLVSCGACMVVLCTPGAAVHRVY